MVWTSPEAEAQIRSIVECMPDPLCIIGRDRALIAFNGEFARLFSGAGSVAQPGSQIDELAREMPDPTIAEFWIDFVNRALTGRPVMSDLWQERDGIKRYYSVSSTPLLHQGELAGMSCTIRDITDRRQTRHRVVIELALTRIFGDEASFTESLEQVLELICETDGWDFAVAWLFADQTDTLIPVAFWHDGTPGSAAFETTIRDLRFAPGHGIPGRAVREDEVIWVPDLSDETLSARSAFIPHMGFHTVVAGPIRDSRRTTGVLEFFARAVRPVDLETSSSLDETGGAIGRLLERQKAEQERRELHRIIERKGTEWALTFDAIESPIFLTTASGRIARLNRAARDLVGQDYSDILGIRFPRVGDSELWRTLGDLVHAVTEGGAACSGQATDENGERSWDISGTIYHSAEADEDRVIIILRDVTQTVNLQDSLRRGEQMAAMGELVAGVAHEVRNPLFGMMATLDAYEPGLQKDDDSNAMFGALRIWIGRLNVLMENLLQYGKSWNVNLRPGTVDECLGQAIDSCRPLADRSHVRLDLSLADPPVAILMDEARLVQAFQNVITNAVQHSPVGSTVQILLRQNSGGVECVVTDRGPGFQSADLHLIFQPFFTRRRGGTGLGLSIVQRVMEEHGGSVVVEANPEGGAAVRLLFPEYH